MLDNVKASWSKFKRHLEQIEISKILVSNDVNQINEFIITEINKATKDSIPIRYKKFEKYEKYEKLNI